MEKKIIAKKLFFICHTVNNAVNIIKHWQKPGCRKKMWKTINWEWSFTFQLILLLFGFETHHFMWMLWRYPTFDNHDIKIQNNILRKESDLSISIENYSKCMQQRIFKCFFYSIFLSIDYFPWLFLLRMKIIANLIFRFYYFYFILLHLESF